MNKMIVDTDKKVTICFLLVPSDIDFVNYVTQLAQPFYDRIRLRFQHLSFQTKTTNIGKTLFSNNVAQIASAASALQPATLGAYGSIDVMGLACTSMSMVVGSSRIDSQIRRGYPVVKHTTDMATAVVKACRHTDIAGARIGVLTPYNRELHKECLEFLTSHDLNVVTDHTFNIDDDLHVAAISPQTIVTTVEEHLVRNDVDMYVIVCSSLRTMEPGMIQELEARVQRPVITSTQAMIWHTLRVAGIQDGIQGYGLLLQSDI